MPQGLKRELVVERGGKEHVPQGTKMTLALVQVFAAKQLAYWGDLDTWGLQMLATARGYWPELRAQQNEHGRVSSACPLFRLDPTYAGATDGSKLPLTASVLPAKIIRAVERLAGSCP